MLRPIENRLMELSISAKPPNLCEPVEDLDIAQLAAYLHLTPDQVNKMAVRGRIPGRKVGNYGVLAKLKFTIGWKTVSERAILRNWKRSKRF